jgi:hypothetical protein
MSNDALKDLSVELFGDKVHLYFTSPEQAYQALKNFKASNQDLLQRVRRSEDQVRLDIENQVRATMVSEGFVKISDLRNMTLEQIVSMAVMKG